jgi:CRP-like cAMP-binding protein
MLELRCYSEGDVIFDQGELGDKLYVILTGCVQVWKVRPPRVELAIS